MGNLISIRNYPVPHGQGNGGGGGVTYVTYNGTSSSGGSGGGSNVSYIMSADGKITRIEGDELNYRYGYIDELESDIISTRKLFSDEIEAEDINTGNLYSNYIESGKIKVEDLEAIKAYINTLDSYEITTEYLTVTKQAHFFELIIDKVRAVGGQIILTPAQAAIDKVYAYKANGALVPDPLTNFDQVHHFDVYWRAQDYTGRGTSNDWVVQDQAYCQSFNVTEPGVYHDIANKYYWRLVTDILDDKMINFTTGTIANIGSTVSETNNIWISLKKTTYQGTLNLIDWVASPQLLYAGVTWEDEGSTPAFTVTGIMHTSSTSLGIQILPTGNNTERLTDTLKFNISNYDGHIKQPNINIGVYFKDGTSLYFPNVEVDDNFDITLNLGNPESQIEAIVVNCTQPVQWFQCHGIRLSNESDKMDRVLYPKASIPEPGDDIVQLGFRGTDDYADRKRQSAIIISAYMSIDTDLRAPSYAQYMGIDNFDLKSHRGSYIDARGAKFVGDAGDATVGGTSLTELKIEQGRISQRVTDNKKDADDHFVQVETQIVQTAENITAYARKTYETKDHAVETKADLESKIEITAEGITQQVSEKYETKTDASETRKTLLSQIEIKADSIKQEVSSKYETKNNASTEYENLRGSISTKANEVLLSVSKEYKKLKDANNEYNYLVGQIKVNADKITSEVNERTTKYNSLSNRIDSTNESIKKVDQLRKDGYTELNSKIDQTAGSITSTVTALGNNVSTLQSVVTQLPNQISANVYNEINGKLLATGIDITKNVINFKSDKIYFTPSSKNTTYIYGKNSEGKRIFALGQYEGQTPALKIDPIPVGGTQIPLTLCPGLLYLGNTYPAGGQVCKIYGDDSTSTFLLQNHEKRGGWIQIDVNVLGKVIINGSFSNDSGHHTLYCDNKGYLKLGTY